MLSLLDKLEVSYDVLASEESLRSQLASFVSEAEAAGGRSKEVVGRAVQIERDRATLRRGVKARARAAEAGKGRVRRAKKEAGERLDDGLAERAAPKSQGKARRRPSPLSSAAREEEFLDSLEEGVVSVASQIGSALVRGYEVAEGIAGELSESLEARGFEMPEMPEMPDLQLDQAAPRRKRRRRRTRSGGGLSKFRPPPADWLSIDAANRARWTTGTPPDTPSLRSLLRQQGRRVRTFFSFSSRRRSQFLLRALPFLARRVLYIMHPLPRSVCVASFASVFYWAPAGQRMLAAGKVAVGLRLVAELLRGGGGGGDRGWIGGGGSDEEDFV